MAWLAEKLIEQFFDWEILGRGTLPACEVPVTPEPPFRPFQGYRAPVPSGIDEGRRHTMLSGLLESLRPTSLSPDIEADGAEDDSLDFRVSDSEPTTELRVHLGRDFLPKRESFEAFILSLDGCLGPLTFEVFGNGKEITVQFVTAPKDVPLIQGQGSACFPEVYFTTGQSDPGLRSAWFSDGDGEEQILEFGLATPFHFPFSTKNADPLTGIVGVLSELDADALGLFQVLFEPVRHPWAMGLLGTVLTEEGDSFFSDGQDLVKATRLKVSKPLFGVVVRFAARSRSRPEAHEILRRLSSSLAVLSGSDANSLVPLDGDGADSGVSPEDLFTRRTRRFGMVLNLEELVALVHFPKPSQLAGSVRGFSRTKAAPAEVLSSSGLELGENVHRDRIRTITLNRDQRVRHMHLIGASGTGKSNLMLNLIRQDIANGEGLAVLDPHGDLIDRVLETIPEDRVDDVILLDPSDEEFPVGFNILSAHSELEKTLLASDLCSVFRRLATSWGDQMTAVFSNAILAFLESSRGGALADLRRFLVEKPFREEFLPTVQDPEVVYFWQHEYPLLSGRPEGSVVTRLNTFLRPKPIRYMVSQRENRLDFTRIMDDGKILLARIPHGLIGEENAHLLGSLLVVKIHQLVMGRQSRQAESRRPFWLYIDEFHHFMTTSMASILSGARKYNLGLVLAHQDLQQLEGRDRDVASAVISNAYTRICFRLGDHDARKMENGFFAFDRNDLQSLGTGEAVSRVGRAEHDFNLAVPWHEIQSGPEQQSVIDTIQARTHERYARPRAEVEIEIAKHRPGIEAQKAIPKEAITKEPTGAANLPKQPASKAKTATEAPQTETPPAKPAQPGEQPTPSPGRGGPEHKALQSLVKRLAESFNYRVTMEKPVLDGQGFADLALERGDTLIAVEISVTTPVEKEIQNLRKCIHAGFDTVVMLSPDRERLRKIEEAASKAFQRSDLERTHFSLPENFSEVLQSNNSEKSPAEGVMHKGYEVKAIFQDIDDNEVSSRKRAIRKTISLALRKQRKK